jgi:hypothetical protein
MGSPVESGPGRQASPSKRPAIASSGIRTIHLRRGELLKAMGDVMIKHGQAMRREP